MTRPIRAFCSHTRIDKPAVEAFAERLRTERGINAWFDKWEIRPGDSIVRKINEGLADADWGLIFYSRNTNSSSWVDAEQETLIYQMVSGETRVIPVMIDEDSVIPAMLKPYARFGIEQFEIIADAILDIDKRPPLGLAPAAPQAHIFVLGLKNAGEDRVHISATIDGVERAVRQDVRVKSELCASYSQFLQGRLRLDAARSSEGGLAPGLSSGLERLGIELGELLYGEGIGLALRGEIDRIPLGGSMDLIYESDSDALLALPFEAAILDGNEVPALHASLTVRRRRVEPEQAVSDSAEEQLPSIVLARSNTPMPGPLKILVAIGAPDEGQTSSQVLDLEQELQHILDSVEGASRHGNAEVRILEVGNPREIRRALETDEYHVLHLAGHGSPGAIELEDEEGHSVPVTVEVLVDELRQANRPLPLVFLSFCHGGARTSDTVGFAQGLIRSGVPMVVSMQARVTDRYASELSRVFYEELANVHEPLASRALAKARRRLESERRQAVSRGAPVSETQPEYGTPSLFCGGEERPLVDQSARQSPLRRPPVHRVHSTVFELGIGDLVGRRRETRRVLRVLRTGEDPETGADNLVAVALLGIGGVGKSSVAGRVMARLKEEGWLVAAATGPFDLGGLAQDLGAALIGSSRENLAERGVLLADPELDDKRRITEIEKLLTQELVLCVVDNFEVNLTLGGGYYRNPETELRIRGLLNACSRGRLLLTCWHPIPGIHRWTADVHLGPLSLAQTRKLFHRLPALGKLSAEGQAEILRALGGHPRVLEFLDGLLSRGQTRLRQVTERLKQRAAEIGVELGARSAVTSDAVLDAIRLSAHDILFEELLGLARESGAYEVLIQASVSSLPWDPAGIAHALHGESQPTLQVESVRRSLNRLVELSLLSVVSADGPAFWAHRWIAAMLAETDQSGIRAASRRAAEYRILLAANNSNIVLNGMEAARCFAAAGEFGQAARAALDVSKVLCRFRRISVAAAFSHEIRVQTPVCTEGYQGLWDLEYQAHLLLGSTSMARKIAEDMVRHYEDITSTEPLERGNERALAHSYISMGDVLVALGKGSEALAYFNKALDLRRGLSRKAPDEVGPQRDFSVVLERVTNILIKSGKTELASEFAEEALEIAERLVEAEPRNDGYQIDLTVSLDQMGAISESLGSVGAARKHFERSIDVLKRLVDAEPGHDDFQRRLSVAHCRMGSFHAARGDRRGAREHFEKDLEIAKRLARLAPERVDALHDLSISYSKLGDLHASYGHSNRDALETALQYYSRSLDIAEEIARGEPGRVDYKRSLSISIERVGKMHASLEDSESASKFYTRCISIRRELIRAELDRVDLRCDLSVTLRLSGDLAIRTGLPEAARANYEEAIEILEHVVVADPASLGYQRDLLKSYARMGELLAGLGPPTAAKDNHRKYVALRERLASAKPDAPTQHED